MTRIWLLGIGLLAAGAVLLWGSSLQQDLLFRVLLLLVLTISWNLMANAGLISLGHSAFWGVGSYAPVILMNRLGLSLPLALTTALIVGALLGAAMARLTGRLSGMFFGIATLALAEGLRVCSLMLADLTGGAGGLTLNAALAPSGLSLRLMALGYAGCAILTAWLLSRSRFQFACRAMRNSAGAAQMIGVDLVMVRTALVAISGLLAAGAGALNALSNGYLDPSLAFTMQNTIMPQIAAILGGVYTIGGSVLGAVAITFIVHATTLVGTQLPGFGLFCLGIVLIVVVIFLPHGLFGWLDGMSERKHRVAPPQPGKLP